MAKRARRKIVMWNIKHAMLMHVRLIVLVLGPLGVIAVSHAVVVKVFVYLPSRHHLKALVKVATVHTTKLKLKHATLMHVS